MLTVNRQFINVMFVTPTPSSPTFSRMRTISNIIGNKSSHPKISLKMISNLVQVAFLFDCFRSEKSKYFSTFQQMIVAKMEEL